MKRVIALAEKKHSLNNQKFDVHDYIFHLKGVAEVVLEFLSKHPNIDKLMKIAYLHDILEDTDTTIDELLSVVDISIVDCIKLLTDKKGKNRKDRHLNTYYLIRESESAVIVKLADRIFNIRYSISNKNNLAKMYFKEADIFKFALYDPRHPYTKDLWKEYDNLVNKLRSM
jgi:(p)ppGpp synthase/HD superfamily hydrolase